MKLDDLIKVAADFPFPKIKRVEIEDEILNLEQSPQLLSFISEEIEWKRNAEIIGPDGTKINTIGKGEKAYIRTPLEKTQLGWNFKIDVNSLKRLIVDLIPCKEGESYFNPSPWDRIDWIENKRVYMRSGELTENPESEEKKEKYKIIILRGKDKLNLGFLNPTYYYLNPFFIGSSEKVNGVSNLFSIELTKTYSLISKSPFKLENIEGTLHIEGNDEIMVIESDNWKEVKPYQIAWNLQNPIIKLDCKPTFRLPLYYIYPAGVIPFFLRYNNGELIMGLVNINPDPIIFTFNISGRIISTEILDPQGNLKEELNTEFDRVRIPIRRYGIQFVRIKIKKMLESFLKRKIIG
ncbi:hypothetical protein DDW09_00610 [Sulfolobus sp. SCGC AB-777_L09]|jgi:hypothetical protein|nr:hypothetical protein [Sulfolobaceae archaeon]PVU71085.1 hypothetical protein DDW09_00610 [Sulfolobus sp. SCGC AB-777_L09]